MERQTEKKASRVLSILLATFLMISVVGCGTTSNKETATTSGTISVNTGTGETTAAKTATTYADEITIDYYYVSANYQGLQSGWFGKILKDKFNMKVNIIAPNISGQAIFQTRSAAGNLGDLIVIGQNYLADTVKAGLLMDLTDLVKDHGSNFSKYATAYEKVKQNLGTDKIYALPTDVSTLSPVEPLLDVEGGTVNNQSGGALYVRWDAYTAIGSPKLNTMDDILPMFKKMQEACPKSDTGKKTYPLSLFKDWDGYAMKAAWESIPTMYGYQIVSGTSTMLTYGDSSKTVTQSLIDDNGLYFKSLKFLYQANQMGLVDPDSSSQNWDSVVAKVQDGQTLFYWWPWASIGLYNNNDRGNADSSKGFEFVPVADMKYYNDGYNPMGQWGLVAGIGSKAKDPERIMDYLNWLASSEGTEICTNGPQGLTWEIKDGQPVLTEFGQKAIQDGATQVPDEYGGGTWKDGSPVVQGMVYPAEIDPNTNIAYWYKLWPSVINNAASKLDKSWKTAMGAESMVDYIKKNNMLAVAAGNSYVAPTDTADIKNKREQCGKAVVDASWQMVFAKDDAKFNSIWTDLKAQLKGFGWDDVAAVDMKIVEECNAARQQTIKDSQK
jgi:hypothetical protein